MLTRREVLIGSMATAVATALPEMASSIPTVPVMVLFDDDQLAADAVRLLEAEHHAAARIDLRTHGITRSAAATHRLEHICGYVLASADRSTMQEVVEAFGAWSFRLVLFGQGPACVHFGGHTTVFLRAGPPMVRKFGPAAPWPAAAGASLTARRLTPT